MTSIFLLFCSNSSSSSIQFSGVARQNSCGMAVGKQRGDLESGCDQGTLVPLSPGNSQGLGVSPLQWKSGSLTSNILLPPSTCLCVTRNEAVPNCSSSRRSLSPCISAHDLPCLLLPLLLLQLLPYFSPLVTVTELPPSTSSNPRVCNVDTLEGGTSVYGHCLQSVHYSINEYISPREELAWTWECVEPWGREGHKFHITDSPVAWGDLSYLGDAQCSQLHLKFHRPLERIEANTSNFI